MEDYQLTFEDIERINTLAIQPGRTAYVDECGNFGFDFRKDGVSTHYIVCAVIVNNENILEIEKKVNEIRKLNFSNNEMKSSSIGNKHSRRAKILTELLLVDFSLIILIADKQAFYNDSPLTEYKGTFVKFLHQKLYESMYTCYPKLKIVEDEYGSSEFQSEFKKYVCKNRPTPNLFNEYDFDYFDSRKCNIVQIADIIAGSTMQHIIDVTAPDVLKIFKGKIIEIINFPKSFIPYKAGENADTSFDKQIYMLADQCATAYIDSNKNSNEEDVRLRILFLKKLLFTVRNINDSIYIHSSEITKMLSNILEQKVTRDYLYRRIVAPLRDADVLISSSSHGYKIPTCVDDIYTYINQTSGIISPMLSRIEKCRSLIKKQTDGKLDILDGPALTKFKRYFGDY
ncbi:DUF3800 domain-containing protein [Anaeromusa acidaminophila]|uniref:DUF3800 domain-containing protein n=1 Tax=Anaeromusa acidaminophila TaxID=81464 RepID=UPI000374F6FA|nr:DUF3800 domain-containing protein [Anaeromusa acidaminophila]